MTVLLAFAWT